MYLCYIVTGKETLYMNIIAGVSSGAIAAGIANPTDVLKVIDCTVYYNIILYCMYYTVYYVLYCIV